MNTGIRWPLGLSTDTFLREYWQKKPLLIRNALNGFREAVTPDELAGLACEHGVESRLICKRGRKRWTVDYGPFDERRFSTLPEKQWTLLVTEVNRHVPQAATLLDRFSFIPNWRVDDVMVSYAVPGGGVGPHVDSYDVFLLQGRGQRRWRYHLNRTSDVTFVNGLALRILSHFEPEADEVLGPGDMLYLPPGFAHDGVAVTECTTYSVGFRAPNRGELTAAFVRSFEDDRSLTDLYTDRDLREHDEPGELTEAARVRVRAMIRRIDLSDAAIDAAFAQFASMLKPGHVLDPPRKRVAGTEVKERLQKGVSLARSEECRFVFFPSGKRTINFYYGSNQERLSGAEARLARAVCRQRRLNAQTLGARDALSKEGLAAIARWINAGALSFVGR